MALRTPLSVTPHLYMGDSTGRPLDKGVVYFGEQDKDPEFYPITLYSDDALTKPLAQPVHTKGGYLYDKGDMVEPHAKEIIYSVKVLDSYGRKVFYKGAMMRNSWNDEVIEQINTAIIDSADAARQVAIDITNDAINNTAVEDGVLADTFVTATASGLGAVAINQREVNSATTTPRAFRAVGNGSEVLASSIVPSVFPDLTALKVDYPFVTSLNDTLDYIGLQAAFNRGGVVIINRPYVINRSLSVNVDNTEVLFMGSGKITIKSNVNIIDVYADNVNILKAKLVGFGSSSTSLYYGTGITLHGVKGCEVSYAKISKTGGSPIALLARNASGVVKSCTDNVIAYNDIDCSIASKRTFDSSGILIGYTNEQATGYSHDNNHIYANRVLGKALVEHGIAMIGHGKGNRFTQNTVSDCLEYGIAVYQSPYIDNTLYDNIVSGNKINNIGHVSDNLCIKGMGIYLQKSDSTVVHGNIIDNVLLGTNNDTNLTRAAIAVNGCVGAVVSDNIIENSKQFGIQFAECYGCKATNNFVDKVTSDLIRITSSSKIDITGNTGLNGGGYGVCIENFSRTTGRADYNGTSGDGINIVGNDLNCVAEGIWINSTNAANKMMDSRIDSNLIKTPAISIYVANAANTSITSNKCKSTTNLARIQVVESDKLTVNCNTLESTAATDSGRIVLSNATNYAVEGNLFSPSNSTTPIYINGQPFKAAKKRFYSNAIPIAGTYEVGDIIWNTSPVLGGSLGWICIVSGTSGTWVQFGEIGSGLVSLTTTSLQNAALSINTVGKYAGKEVFNQTDSKKYYAEGDTPTSRWMRFDTGASVTPV